jgi:asparagine synthase (glutamine-hydrolysing)
LSATEAAREPAEVRGERPPIWVASFDRRRRSGDAGASPLALETEGSAAPEQAADRAHAVVFDGWIYNREGLQAVAAVDEVDDATLILEAYRRLGRDVLPRVKGRFALLIWDGTSGELLCARDRLGTYPLFYAERGDQLLLSCGIEDLVSRPGVATELNRTVLAEHLSSRWPSLEDTYYAAVRRVPPGHLMSFGAGPPNSYRYWDPVPTPDSDSWISEKEVDQFDEAFYQAVNRCLELGPAGIFLSGGLDSVSVATVATDSQRSRQMPPPWGLSLVFPHPDTNEEAVQRGVADTLGIPQLLLGFDEAVGPRGRLLATVEGSRTAPTPLMGLWSPAYWRLAAEGRERGCKVILTGGGGDEMLSFSPYLAADRLRDLDLPGLWRLFRARHRASSEPTWRMARAVFWRNAAQPLLNRTARRALNAVSPSLLRARLRGHIRDGIPSWVRPDPELTHQLEERGVNQIAKWPPRSSFYYHESRSWLDHPVASVEMERVFEEGRLAGVPILEPYWDADLQEFLYHVPPELLTQGGRTKGLVRGMLDRRFPELGFGQQKKVVGASFAYETFESQVPKALREMGGAPGLSQLGIVDQQRLEEALARFSVAPDRRTSNQLFHVLSLEAWVRPRL